jgi:hypothetical protein
MAQKSFNFGNIFSDYEEYRSTKDDLKEGILADFPSRKTQAKIIIGSDVVDSTLGSVMVNLLIMKPFVGKGLRMTREDLFSFESVTEGNLDAYFNRVISRFKVDGENDFEELRASVAEAINEMSDLSGDLNVLAGNSISFHDFVKMSVEDEKAREIFRQKISKRMQFDEIEDKFNKLGKQIEKYFKSKKDSELHPFVVSETGINRKQMTQAIGFIGLKPDIDGSIIPVAIEDNYLIGLSCLENYFINAKGTRKALITNSRMVRRSGYLTRKLSLSMIDRHHDNNLADCNTRYLLDFEVKDSDMLSQISGRHYYELNESGERISDMRTVPATGGEELIGKKIGLRSPVTCAGKHVCKTCYGSELSEINKGLNTGLISVMLLTNPLTQKLLSAKHLLTTNTEKIDWGKDFMDHLYVNMNSIYFSDPDASVVFSAKGIKADEEEDSDYIKEFSIYSGSKKIADYRSPKDEIRFYVNMAELKSKDAEYDQDKETYTVSAKMFSDDEPLFTFLAKNNELTKSLEQIVDLIETVDHLGEKDYHGMVKRFNELLVENGLNMNSVHAEMIVSNLVRDAETGKRLDFSKKSLDNYEIIRVSKSVMDAPLSVSLAFERLDEQLVDLDTYEKDGVSLMDHLYK